jgi:hypothetical protein
VLYLVHIYNFGRLANCLFVCFCLFLVCSFVWVFVIVIHNVTPWLMLSNLASVTITSERAANLDIYLAIMDFGSEWIFTCYTCCDTGLTFFFLGHILKTSDSHF